MVGLIASQVGKLTPQFVLAAAHMTVLKDEATNAPRRIELPSVSHPKALVAVVWFVEDPSGLDKDETPHAYTMVIKCKMPVPSTRSQVNLIYNKGDSSFSDLVRGSNFAECSWVVSGLSCERLAADFPV